MIKPCYVDLGQLQTHVLAGGRGPALVMLHALPLWSKSLLPLATQLADRQTVILPDIPGYGLSDPLPPERNDLAAQADWLLRLLDALGVGAFALHAAEDSAALAVMLLRVAAPRITALILEDPCVLSETERQTLLADGLADLRPDPSGSHLVRIWDAVRSRFLFRPREFPRLANRLDRDMPPPEQLDELVKAYMRAGTDPHAGVRRTLAESAGCTLESIDAPPPTLLLCDPRCADDRLPKGRSLSVARLAADPAPRAAAIERFLADHAGAAAPALRWPSLGSLPTGRFSRVFIPVPGGHLHARISPAGSQRAVIGLHDPAGSHALVMPFVAGLAADRPVIALDLPGNGESDNVLGAGEIGAADYARAVIDALDALGIDAVDAIGRYSGGPVAMEMAFARPQLVRHVVIAAVAIYPPDEVDALMRHYTPSVRPQRDGSHLLLAWHNMKNQALFWPWFRQTREGIVWGEPLLDPVLLHQRVFDLLRVGDLYRVAYAALWNYPMAQRLPALRTPTLLCAPAWDPIYAGLAEVQQLAPAHQSLTLPPKFADWVPHFAQFFDAEVG